MSAGAGIVTKAVPSSNADDAESTGATEIQRLTRAESSALALVAHDPQRSGLCCDFDGTIAPIVVDPQAARPVPAAVVALHEIARELAVVAVISGRPAAFLAERLELESYRSPLRAIGLHGLEECFADGRIERRAGVSAWRPTIETVRDRLQAVLPKDVKVEDKGYGITVHWRSLTASGAERESIATTTRELVRTVASEYGLVPRMGKASVELVLPLGIDKGTVVSELCTGLDRAAYLGDDLGDLRAFGALDRLRARSGLGSVKIAVNGADAPRELLEEADLVLDGPHATAGFLAALAEQLGRT